LELFVAIGNLLKGEKVAISAILLLEVADCRAKNEEAMFSK